MTEFLDMVKSGGNQSLERQERLNQTKSGTSLVVQWLRLCTPNAGHPGLIPGQGTRSIYCN